MQPDKRNKTLTTLLLVLGFLGFADATYLTAEHYIGGTIACSVFHGCEVVTTSQYSTVLGIPIALLGALYYFAIFIAVLIYSDSRNKFLIKLVAAATSFGFLFSIGLVYVQLGILNAICPYCMGSALTTTLLFIGSWYLLSIEKKRSRTQLN